MTYPEHVSFFNEISLFYKAKINANFHQLKNNEISLFYKEKINANFHKLKHINGNQKEIKIMLNFIDT